VSKEQAINSELNPSQVNQDGNRGIVSKLVTIMAVAMSAFHVYTCIFGVFDFVTQRGVHMAFGLTLILLQMPLVKTAFKGRFEKSPVLAKIFSSVDVLLILLMWAGVYVARWEYQMRVQRAGQTSFIAVIAGFVMLVILLETSRRQLGLILPSLAVISIIYAWAGPRLPLIIAHRGYSLERIFGFLAANPDGLFGVTMAVSATTIFLFVLFGAFLEASGANDFINNSAMALTGRAKSGPAQAAVLASALMGTINGSAVANVVGTGTFTIPLMKRQGYKPEFAGAVESVASTGGQILPPVMGAGAFIMVVFTEIAYSKIVVAAAIPAILYFLGISVALQFRAERVGLKGLSKEELPDLKNSLKEGIFYLPAIAILIYMLFVIAVSPMMAAFYATIAIPVTMFFSKAKRFDLKKFIGALESAGKGATTIVAGCACAGVIVSMVAITGLGVVFSDMMLSMAGNNLFLALLFTAVACIVLGMGLPTTAAYVIAASIVAPALQRLGVSILAAHLFVFYFACLSAITPPVALACYAAAGIAKGDPMKTGVEACKLGFAGFVVPFMFVYSDLLLANGPFMSVAWAFITALVGVISMSAGFQGYLIRKNNIIESILLLAGGLGMVHPAKFTDFIGIGVVAIVLAIQYMSKKKQSTVAA
jgi:TRAP transporter 4TM/12TM fusion protein